MHFALLTFAITREAPILMLSRSLANWSTKGFPIFPTVMSDCFWQQCSASMIHISFTEQIKFTVWNTICWSTGLQLWCHDMADLISRLEIVINWWCSFIATLHSPSDGFPTDAQFYASQLLHLRTLKRLKQIWIKKKRKKSGIWMCLGFMRNGLRVGWGMKGNG